MQLKLTLEVTVASDFLNTKKIICTKQINLRHIFNSLLDSMFTDFKIIPSTFKV